MKNNKNEKTETSKSVIEIDSVDKIDLSYVDFSWIQKQLDYLQKEKEFKRKIYQAYQEYIMYLESLFECEENEQHKESIGKEIVRLKAEQAQYYSTCSLELASYSLISKKQKESKPKQLQLFDLK